MSENILSVLSRYLPYIVMMVGFIGLPLSILILWLKVFRNKTVIELCRNIDGRYHIIKTVKIDVKQQTLEYNKSLYVIDYKYAVMKNNILNGHFASFRFDIEDSKPLRTDINELPRFKTFNPVLFYRIMKTKIFAEILSGVADSQYILIILIVSVLTLAISGYTIYQSMQTQEQVKLLLNIITKGVTVK